MSATINIIDVRRIAAANGATDLRVVRAMQDIGAAVHTINGNAFANADDEDRIAQHLADKREGK